MDLSEFCISQYVHFHSQAENRTVIGKIKKIGRKYIYIEDLDDDCVTWRVHGSQVESCTQD